MQYNLHEISLNRGKSYRHSFKWLKSKKATLNLKNNDDKCFQYDLIVAFNDQNIKNKPERVSKIQLFNDQYNWKETDFPPKQ